MNPATAVSTRLAGLALVVILCLAGGLPGPGRALAVPGEPTPVGVWPLTPAPLVVAGFDPPSTTWGAGHRGVDLLGRVGQAVRAALPGTVSFAGRIAGRGVVVVDHGATRTTYEPVSAAADVGDRVAPGTRIGRLELGGSHCFPRACLHWGWLRGETYLDPLLLVGAGPVRLLPLGAVPPDVRGPGAAPVGAEGAEGATAGVPGWAPPATPYAAWHPPVRRAAPAQARGCACW